MSLDKMLSDNIKLDDITVRLFELLKLKPFLAASCFLGEHER